MVQAGLDMLVDYDWLTARRVDTGGRPSIFYRHADHDDSTGN
jgi:hypothetical protein